MDKANVWQDKRNKAVDLVAADILPMNKIAEECGVKPRTFTRWLESPAFKAKVEIKRKAMSERILAAGIALKADRVARADDRWRRMHQVIAERAADPVNSGVAGGSTGLLVHTLKGVGSGNAAQVIDEWEVDTGLLSEIRAHEEQVSKELGQWPSSSPMIDVNATVQVAVLLPDQARAVPAVRVIEAAEVRK